VTPVAKNSVYPEKPFVFCDFLGGGRTGGLFFRETIFGKWNLVGGSKKIIERRIPLIVGLGWAALGGKRRGGRRGSRGPCANRFRGWGSDGRKKLGFHVEKPFPPSTEGGGTMGPTPLKRGRLQACSGHRRAGVDILVDPKKGKQNGLLFFLTFDAILEKRTLCSKSGGASARRSFFFGHTGFVATRRHHGHVRPSTRGWYGSEVCTPAGEGAQTGVRFSFLTEIVPPKCHTRASFTEGRPCSGYHKFSCMAVRLGQARRHSCSTSRFPFPQKTGCGETSGGPRGKPGVGTRLRRM